MLSQLKTEERVVGAKQTLRAMDDGRALEIFVAGDADPRVTDPIRARCEASGLPIVSVPTMAELGAACGIAVGAAVAARIR